VIGDRDTKFTAASGEVLHAAHLRILKTPPQAPRADAVMERWIGDAGGTCPAAP
jgi:putative transposase